MASRLGNGSNGGDTLGDVRAALAGRAFGTFQPVYTNGVGLAAGSLDCSLGDTAYVVVTDATAFALPAPTNPQDGAELTVIIKNSSGGVMGAVTFNAAFKNAGAFTVPANTLRRTITFRYNSVESVWSELNRSAADSIA